VTLESLTWDLYVEYDVKPMHWRCWLHVRQIGPTAEIAALAVRDMFEKAETMELRAIRAYPADTYSQVLV
jgi:hypothetical protein